MYSSLKYRKSKLICNPAKLSNRRYNYEKEDKKKIKTQSS